MAAAVRDYCQQLVAVARRLCGTYSHLPSAHTHPDRWAAPAGGCDQGAGPQPRRSVPFPWRRAPSVHTRCHPAPDLLQHVPNNAPNVFYSHGNSRHKCIGQDGETLKPSPVAHLDCAIAGISTRRKVRSLHDIVAKSVKLISLLSRMELQMGHTGENTVAHRQT